MIPTQPIFHHYLLPYPGRPENLNTLSASLFHRNTLSNYNCDYLLELGVTPEPIAYKKWQLRKESDQARKNNDPNLVVSCRGDDATFMVNIYEVITADDKVHCVTKESYDNMMEDPFTCISMSLNNLVNVDQHTFPSMQERFVTYVVDRSKMYTQQIETNDEIAVKETQGKYYGSRARFEYVLSSTLARFSDYLRLKEKNDSTQIDSYLKHHMPLIRSLIHPELQNNPTFTKYI